MKKHRRLTAILPAGILILAGGPPLRADEGRIEK